jgi:hypothetical protein
MTPRSATTGSGRAEAWTWADLLSSYRFWALVSASTCAYLAMRYLSNLLSGPLRLQWGLSAVAVGSIYAMKVPAGVIALCLGWAVSRSKPVGALIAAGAVQLAGAMVIWSAISVTTWSTASIVATLALGSFLIYTGQLTFMIGIPVALVGARCGPKDFFVAYGTMLLLFLYCDTTVLSLSNIGGLKVAMATLPVLALAALLLLASVPGTLFSDSPPPRARVLEPVRRGAVSVAFLTLVPFYVFYWLYRVHGETARLAPSRSLLTPGAAAGIPLTLAIVPGILSLIARFSNNPNTEAQSMGGIVFLFILPVLLAALIDELNEAALSRGADRPGSTTATFIWTLVLPPVGVGLVQAALNRLNDSVTTTPGEGRQAAQ